MKQHVPTQIRKDSTVLPKSDFLRHAAVQVVPEKKRASTNPPETHFNRDFSQTTVRPSLPVVGQNYGTAACPLSPRTCPFGGACHKCPAKANANTQPTIGTSGGLNT
jgi:hypothetical protein